MEEGAGQRAEEGWPLGLPPMSAAAARLSIASIASTFVVSTPSLTSFSSSDLDTESTGSFFPEKSTTLGSLIGIQSSSQLASVEGGASPTEGCLSRGKRRREHSRSHSCWSMLACGGSLPNETLDTSPSLAHFLCRERRESLSQRQNNSTEYAHVEQEPAEGQGQDEVEGSDRQRQEDARFEFDRFVPQSGFDDSADTSASRPCAPTIRFILQHPSPTSYLSTDWNVYSDLSQDPHIRKHSSPSHGCFHTFWSSRCCRLSTGVAN